MNRFFVIPVRLLCLFCLTFLVVACDTPSEAEPTAELPTAELLTATAPPASPVAIDPTETATVVAAPATVTAQPTAMPTEAPTAVATAAPVAAENYRVAFVADDDELNVRSGPGPTQSIVGTFSPDATGIRVTGGGEEREGSVWVPVAADGITGWVNSRFLAVEIAKQTFCDEEEPRELLDELQTAVAEQNGAALAELVHPERGLRIHHSWWNPEVIIPGEAISTVFTDTTAYDWGIEDGSGFEIVGPFSEEILPILERDLLPADDIACNELVHGPTAGLVQLPEGYDAVNYYAMHRAPGPDQVELDWGTWVVGIERWDGRYYLSYLVHYQWEI